MAFVQKKSVLPIYLIGFTWLVWALLRPLHTLTHFVTVALLSALAYFLGKCIFPDKGYQEPEVNAAPEQADSMNRLQKIDKSERLHKPASTVSPEIDKLITERDRAISEMRRLNDSIKDEKLSLQISHLEETTGKIIGAVVESPGKLPQIRKFMNYYLPTTLKLLNAYDRMDATGASGMNIDGTMGKIETMMATVCTAFDRQLDILYGDEALDIAADITVMEQMLAQEGLGGMSAEVSEDGDDGITLQL